MLIDAPISIFKDYDRYWYEYEQHENYSSTLYVVEKETGKRVAKHSHLQIAKDKSPKSRCSLFDHICVRELG